MKCVFTDGKWTGVSSLPGYRRTALLYSQSYFIQAVFHKYVQSDQAAIGREIRERRVL